MKTRKQIYVGSFVLLAALAGCRSNYDPVVWRTDCPSPDGSWLATARTDQYGGFGSAYLETVITLRKLDGTVNHGKPFDILEYPGGTIRKSYVLSDENAGGGVNLRLRWSTPRTLEVDFTGSINPDLQVVKFGGIDIAYREAH